MLNIEILVAIFQFMHLVEFSAWRIGIIGIQSSFLVPTKLLWIRDITEEDERKITQTKNPYSLHVIKFWEVFIYLIYLKLVLWLLLMIWKVHKINHFTGFYTNSISRQKILKSAHSVTQRDAIATAILNA